MSANKLLRSCQAGFTLVEITVVTAVLGIICVTFMGMVTSYFVTINRNNQLTEMTVNSQNLLRSTVESLRFGDGVRQTNQLSGPGTSVGSWSTSDSNFVIVIAVPALDSNKDYIINPDTGSPYMNEYVYYKDGSTLMRRKLANADAPGNTLITTCAPNIATASCPADTELAKYVQSMIFTFYDQDASQTATATAARSVNITLNMQRDAPGDPIDLTTSIRVTLRNRF